LNLIKGNDRKVDKSGHDLYSSPNIIWVIKAWWMRWAVYMAFMHASFGGENDGKKPLGRLGGD